MRRIIAGEFKSMKSILKLIEKDTMHYSVYADIDSLIHYGIDEDDDVEIVFRIEHIEEFNKRYEFISKHREKIYLLIQKRDLKQQMPFLKNEGYRIISRLSEIDATEKEVISEKRFISPKIIVIPEAYEKALRLSQVIASETGQKVLFIDADATCTFTLKRLKENPNAEWVYLNEYFRDGFCGEVRREGSIWVLPIAENTLWDQENQNQLIKVLEKNRLDYDLQIVYCGNIDQVLMQRLSTVVSQFVWFCRCEYEMLVRTQGIINLLGLQSKASIYAINFGSARWDYLLLKRHIGIRVEGIVSNRNIPSNDASQRWIELSRMRKKDMKGYQKIMRSLNIIRRIT
jgi:hypothetical protein